MQKQMFESEVLYAMIHKDRGALSTLEQKVDSLSSGFNYIGSVDDISDLPASGTVGDQYTVLNDDNALYVWDGEQWVRLAPDLSVITDVIGNLFSDAEAMSGATGITRVNGSEYVGTASAFQTFLLNNYTLDPNADSYVIAFDIYTEANSSSSGTGLEVQYGNHSSKSTLASFDNDQTDPYHFESFFSVTYSPTAADKSLGLKFKANDAPNNIWHISNIRLVEGSEIPDGKTAKDVVARDGVGELKSATSQNGNFIISPGAGASSAILNVTSGSNANAASGDYSYAEGFHTSATGTNSHAEGDRSTASGESSHAEGTSTTASGRISHAEGLGTIANHVAQRASGAYNVADPSAAAATAKGNYIEIVGNGTSNSNRSNARTLDWEGNEVLAGNLTAAGGSITVGQTTFTENQLSGGVAAPAMIAPAYSATNTYAVGDYVTYNNALYRCKTAISTAEAWTAAHWEAAKVGPDLKDLKSSIGEIESAITYPDGTYDTLTTTTLDKKYYIPDTNVAGKLNFADNNYANTTVVPCKKGDKFKASWRHMSAVVGIVYANEDCTEYYGLDIPVGTTSAVETDYEVEIEIDCENVIFNGTSGYSTTVKKFIPATVKDKIANIESKLSTYGNVYTVSADGSCDFTTIQAAVDGSADGDTILIYPGTYKEQIVMTGKVRHLIGVDKATCIITDDSSDYRTPPIWMGAGSVQNLTIEETHANPDPDLLNGDDTDGKNFNYQRAYTIHVEDYATCHDADAVTLIDNCILRNTKRCCLGMGMYQGHTIIVRNCDLWTGMYDRTADVNRGVIYFHSRSTDSADTTDQTIRLIGNTAYSETSLTLFIGDSSRFTERTSEMECEFINNMFYSSINGKADSTVGGNTTPSTNVTYNPDSYGNNIAKLNVQ